MAETLKWPHSLAREIKAERKTSKQKPPAYSKIFFALASIGIALVLITKVYTNNIILGLYIFLAWIFIAFMIMYGYKIFTSDSENTKAMKGLKGEAAVAYELDSLPQGWYIINDITVNGSQIDHIAIGPIGIFCLETKNWNNAGCDEDGNWYHFHTGHWAPVNKNPARQNYAHKTSLEEFLKEKIGVFINVKSIVVLSHPTGKYSIKKRVVPPGHTLICLPPELHRILQKNTGSDVLSPGETRYIAYTLANL